MSDNPKYPFDSDPMHPEVRWDGYGHFIVHTMDCRFFGGHQDGKILLCWDRFARTGECVKIEFMSTDQEQINIVILKEVKGWLRANPTPPGCCGICGCRGHQAFSPTMSCIAYLRGLIEFRDGTPPPPHRERLADPPRPTPKPVRETLPRPKRPSLFGS